MKKILCVLLVIVMIFSLTACNYNLIDTSWDFNYAYITMPNGEIVEVTINSWTEDENSVTIKGDDGQVYSVSYHNCLLTKEKWER